MLGPNEIMKRMAVVLRKRMDTDPRSFSFGSPLEPSLQLYPVNITAITLGFITKDDLPQAGTNPANRGITFREGMFSTRDPRLAAALTYQKNIEPSPEWYPEVLELTLKTEEEQKAVEEAKAKADAKEAEDKAKAEARAKAEEAAALRKVIEDEMRPKLTAEIKREMKKEAEAEVRRNMTPAERKGRDK